MRSLLFLLVVLALSFCSAAHAKPVAQGDPLVAKAAARIASVEAEEAALSSGDVAAADKLITKLAWAGKRLNAVVKQGTDEWKAAKARHDAVLAKIEAKKAGPKPNPKPSPNPGPKPPPGPAPQPSPTPAPTVDQAKLSNLNQSIIRDFENAKILPLKSFLDSNRVNGLQREIKAHRTKLAAFPASHEQVKLVAGNLATFEALIQGGIDRIEADKAAAPKLRQLRDSLKAKYDREKMPSAPAEPYAEAELRAWARDLARLRSEVFPADRALIQASSANIILQGEGGMGHALQLLMDWESAATKSQDQIRFGLDFAAEQSGRTADFILEIDLDDENKILQRILGKGSFDGNMRRLREAEHAVAMATVVDEIFGRKDAPDREAQAKKVEAGIVRLKELAHASLEAVRLPEAKSTDPKLLKVAAATLKQKKNKIKGWERLVIDAQVTEHESRSAYLDVNSRTSATVTYYDYKWEEFQVTTVEEVDGVLWLYAHKLKRYSKGDSTTLLNEWRMTSRFELTPILRENLPDQPSDR